MSEWKVSGDYPAWSAASDIPEWNHYTAFPDKWWNERRQRDYYIDPATGGVKLRPDSPTADKLRGRLMEDAEQIAKEDEQMSEWQPIETAPLDGNAVLIWEPSMAQVLTAVRKATTGLYEANNGPRFVWTIGEEPITRDDYFGDPHLHPTHWMPLPEPPK